MTPTIPRIPKAVPDLKPPSEKYIITRDQIATSLRYFDQGGGAMLPHADVKQFLNMFSTLPALLEPKSEKENMADEKPRDPKHKNKESAK